MAWLVVLAALVGVAEAHGNSIRGLNPELSAQYSGAGGTFTCISGVSKTIPFSRVNDDYCDCPDGSDEPGTAACHNGRFYCRNLGHEPRLLASSFVDDGVCDCCDGADEAKGKCKNTCLEASAVHREALNLKILNYEEALRRKEQYVERARSFKEELRLKAGTIDADFTQQSTEVERLRGEVSRLEAEEAAARAEEARLAAVKAEEERLAAEEAAAAASASAGAEGQIPTADTASHEERVLTEEQNGEAQPEEREETPEERGRRIASQWTNDPEAAAVPGSDGEVGEDDQDQDGQYDGTEDQPGDYDRGTDVHGDEEQQQQQHDEHHHQQQHRSRPPRPAEDASAHQRSEWEELMMFVNMVKQWASNWMTTLSKIWDEGIRSDVLAYRERLRSQRSAKQSAMRRRAHILTKSRRQSATAAPGNDAAAPAHADPNSPLGEARTRLYEAENTLRELQKDKDNIRTYLQANLDFGPNDIFLALADKCYSSYQTRWTYEICMFKTAIQREGYSNTVTVGRWSGFDDDYKKMLFKGGDECWNVGPRSLTVSMSCGGEEELSEGEEPATCAYAAKFVSPALCTEEELEELQQQMRNLEAFEKEVAELINKEAAAPLEQPAQPKDEL